MTGWTASWKPGSAVRAPAPPSPTWCSAGPTRPARQPRRSPSLSRTRRGSRTGSANAERSSTARASSSATAGTTPSVAPCATRSVTACRTRRSVTTISSWTCWTPEAGTVRVSCTITNDGATARGGSGAALRRRPGCGGAPSRSGAPRVREGRVSSPAHPSRVSFELESRDFAYWDAAAVRPDGRDGLWRREGGEFRIEVGASSQDIRLAASIDLPDDPTITPLVPDAELIDIAASRFVQGHAG